MAGAGARHSHCASLGLRPQGCSRPQALPCHKRGRGLITDNSAPQRRNSGQEERGRTPHWGPPSPIHAEQQSGPVAAPYRFSPGWYWGSVDVK